MEKIKGKEKMSCVNNRKINRLISKEITVTIDEKTTDFLDDLNDAIIILNNRKIIYVNTKVCEISKYDRKELMNTDINCLMQNPKEHILDILRKSDVSLKDNKITEIICKNKELKLFFYQYVDNVKDDIDVIVLKEIDKENRYNIRNDLFFSMCHEIKTPIGVLFSALQVLNYDIKKEEVYNESVWKHMKMMEQNCYRLMKISNNLLDIAKLNDKCLYLNVGNYNIIQVIEDITMSIGDYANNKGLNIVFDTDVEEKIIACDPCKLERVVLNLLSNAVKFTEKGGSIFVNIYDGEEKIKISIKDTGIGIPEGKQKTIFDRFSQVDENQYKNQKGTGIGLYIVKEIVEQHKGKVYINKEYKQGSEFIIELPCKVVEDKEINYKEQYYINNNFQNVSIEFSDIT